MVHLRSKFVSNKLFVVSVLALAASLFLVTMVSAANPIISCSIPLNVICEVEDADGLQQIIVQLNTGLGLINVVDETYENCPTQATVSWDPIVPHGDIFVVDCDGNRSEMQLGGDSGDDIDDLKPNPTRRPIDDVKPNPTRQAVDDIKQR